MVDIAEPLLDIIKARRIIDDITIDRACRDDRGDDLGPDEA
jgi:hypothetical protein